MRVYFFSKRTYNFLLVVFSVNITRLKFAGFFHGKHLILRVTIIDASRKS